jgi:hypothetical protein
LLTAIEHCSGGLTLIHENLESSASGGRYAKDLLGGDNRSLRFISLQLGHELAQPLRIALDLDLYSRGCISHLSAEPQAIGDAIDSWTKSKALYITMQQYAQAFYRNFRHASRCQEVTSVDAP